MRTRRHLQAQPAGRAVRPSALPSSAVVDRSMWPLELALSVAALAAAAALFMIR